MVLEDTGALRLVWLHPRCEGRSTPCQDLSPDSSPDSRPSDEEGPGEVDWWASRVLEPWAGRQQELGLGILMGGSGGLGDFRGPW